MAPAGGAGPGGGVGGLPKEFVCAMMEAAPAEQADTAMPLAAAPAGEQEPTLSKRARKRAAKQALREEQRRAKKALRKERKQAEREERQARAPAAAAPAGSPRQASMGTARLPKEVWRSRIREALERTAELPAIAIDLSHGALMREHERKSLASQVMFAYGVNKRAERPLPYHLTSYEGELAENFRRISGFERWPVGVHTRPYWEVFEPSSVVVLSAESPNVLHTLSPGKVYVVGGIVDRNRHKGLLHAAASEHGLASARLPLDELSTMPTRKVLAVNHVVEMLIRFHQSGSWPDAIQSTVPQRKGLVLKQGEGDAKQGEGEVEAEGTAEEQGEAEAAD